MIRSDQYTNFGYRVFKGFQPRNWFQFADDAASVTSLESENQMLLNVFSKWCRWSDMLVRVDKCHSFGIRKKGSIAAQYKPKLYIDNKLVSPTGIDEHFTYLGRHFDFKMSDLKHKENLISTVTEQLSTIDRLPLHPRNKLLLYQCYTLSKISWDMTVTNITSTWMKNNVDNLVSRYIKSWLEIPISGTLNVITLSKRKFGLGVILPSTRLHQCQVTFRKSLSKSQNKNIRKLYNTTSKETNVQYDQYLSTKDVLVKIRRMSENRLKDELTTQSLVIKSIWNNADSKYTNSWSSVLEQLPQNLYSFVIRYLNNTLANGTNAVKWGITKDSSCRFCTNNQTLGHVIGGCSVALVEKRYNWRHDSILLNIAKILCSFPELDVYCDINEHFKNPSIITGERYRPDIIFIKNKLLLIIELTVGFETNMMKNFERKKEKYEQLIYNLSTEYTVEYVNLSLGALGVVNEKSELKKKLSKFGINDQSANFITKRIINICIRTTYYIFCMRNKEWENPEHLAW